MEDLLVLFAHTNRGYVGVGPCSLPPEMCKVLITDLTGLNVSCAFVSPGFVQVRVTLYPDELFLTVQRRYSRTFRDNIWTRLHTLTCPVATQDCTLSIQNVSQEGVNPCIQPFPKSLVDYKELFFWHMVPLVCGDTPEVVYSQLVV